MMGEVNARALRDLWNENKLKIVTYRVMVWLKSNLAEKWQNENKTKPITTVTKNMIKNVIYVSKLLNKDAIYNIGSFPTL